MPDLDDEQFSQEVKREPLKQVDVQIEIEQPTSFVYSNIASVSISPWDVRIGFADFGISTAEGRNLVKPTVAIVMPPEHAAGLMFILMDQLTLFEKQFGRIRNKKWQMMRREAAVKASATPPAAENE